MRERLAVSSGDRVGAAVSPARAQRYRTLLQEVLARADIRLDGARRFDIEVSDDRFFERVVRGGALALGEAYVDGWWECDALDELTSRFLGANLHKGGFYTPRLLLAALALKARGVGDKSQAFEVGDRHYDLGNRLFTLMLDNRMTYSCAYWKDAATLDEAQENKLDLICRKIGLRPGMRVLDIGCGWGSWARFAAERYGARVVGVTVSKEQGEYARRSCAGLPVEIRVQDYRELGGRFDRVVSIGMFEHVGHRHFRTFMRVVERCLADDGLFFLQTIVGNEPLSRVEFPWLDKYIFPNGELPSLAQLARSVEGVFVVEALHRLAAAEYERTLEAWYDNFVSNWSALEGEYGPRFYRMWTYYLLLARGSFRARIVHVWQGIFSKDRGGRGGNERIFDDVAAFEAR